MTVMSLAHNISTNSYNHFLGCELGLCFQYFVVIGVRRRGEMSEVRRFSLSITEGFVRVSVEVEADDLLDFSPIIGDEANAERRIPFQGKCGCA